MSQGRAFAVLASVLLLILGLLPLVTGSPTRPALLGLAALIALLGLAWPRALGPVRALWLRLGRMLGHVTRPIGLAVLYYGVLTPFSWFRRRPRPPSGESFWVPAEPPSPLDRPF